MVSSLAVMDAWDEETPLVAPYELRCLLSSCSYSNRCWAAVASVAVLCLHLVRPAKPA